MLLYLVQHAEAKKVEEDPERGLTDKGFRDIARTAVYAQKLGVRVSAILSQRKEKGRTDREGACGLSEAGEGRDGDR